MDGDDGVSVTNAEINSNGELVLTYSTGQRSNLGNVVGADGKDGADGQDGQDGLNGQDGDDGISVVKSEINAKGELVLTYSNNMIDNLGVVIGADGRDGADGKDGQNGTDGQDGVGIDTITINQNDELEITLSSGTKLNLGVIKGADGANGQDGADGKDGIGISGTSVNEQGELVISYSNGTTTNLGKVVGSDGKDGTNGQDGQDGADGEDGIGVTNTEINEAGELVITYSDGNSKNLGVIVGTDGADGTNGVDGQDGEDGQDGIGISKSEINDSGELVITYSNGSEQNLGNIVGADGADGQDGITPQLRINQDSNEWEVSTNNGVSWTSTGVQATGAKGQDGADGEDGTGITAAAINESGELVLTFSDSSSINLGRIVGKDGTNGTDGKDGANGQDGADGVGIANVTISPEGALSVELTNGTTLELGNIKGTDGIGISKSEINSAGELVLTYSNGQVSNLGKVVGTDGSNGADGRGIQNVTLSASGDLSVVLTDNTVLTLGNVKGEKGDKGDKGDKGEKGDPGEDGRGIANMEIINGELIVTYTDDPQNPVNIGSVGNSGTGSETTDGDFIYVLLSDGTYGIKASSTFALSDVTIPASYKGIAVTQIMDNGFENCDTITSLTLPDSLIKIGQHAFTNCAGLTTLTVPDDVNFIGAFAFYGTGLTSATLPAPDTWSAGIDGFSYVFLITPNAQAGGAASQRIDTYSLSNAQNAAKALTQPVEIWVGITMQYSMNTNHYMDKYWYSQDWTRAE